MDKPCAWCEAKIDAQATACPHCLREQPVSPIRPIGLLVLAIIAFFVYRQWLRIGDS